VGVGNCAVGGIGKYGPPLLRARDTANPVAAPGDVQDRVTRPLPPIALGEEGMPGAAVGVSVPPAPPTPQAGSSSASAAREKSRRTGVRMKALGFKETES